MSALDVQSCNAATEKTSSYSCIGPNAVYGYKLPFANTLACCGESCLIRRFIVTAKRQYELETCPEEQNEPGWR